MVNKIINRLKRYYKFLSLASNMSAIAITEIIMQKYGWSKSFKTKMPIDAKGNPVPWYTYPAIEFLEQLDFTNKIVLEYGSGNSSLYWGKRAKKVVSIEHDKKWYGYNKKIIAVHNEIYLCEEKSDYVEKIKKIENKFDIIVVDGVWRYACAKMAIDKLADGGFIILDNSDWHPETAKLLRENDLIQIDFHGFGTINAYTWTTSLFLKRDYNFQPKGRRQPSYALGGLEQLAIDDKEE